MWLTFITATVFILQRMYLKANRLFWYMYVFAKETVNRIKKLLQRIMEAERSHDLPFVL